MTKRKPRKRNLGPTQRQVLESLAARLLVERALRTLKQEHVAYDDASLVTLAATRMVGASKDAILSDDEYSAIWARRIAELIVGYSDLPRLVHSFVDRLPLYLTAAPSELAQAFWMDTLNTQVSDVVEDVLHELDVNGEPRFLALEDDHFMPNPAFVEPG